MKWLAIILFSTGCMSQESEDVLQALRRQHHFKIVEQNTVCQFSERLNLCMCVYFFIHRQEKQAIAYQCTQ